MDPRGRQTVSDDRFPELPVEDCACPSQSVRSETLPLKESQVLDLRFARASVEGSGGAFHGRQ